MKVLAVIDALRFGGAENLLSTLATVGPKHDLEIEVLSLSSATGSKSSWLSVLQESGLRPTFLGVDRLAQRDAVPRVARAIRDSGCDVVHAHLEDSATLVPIATRLTGHGCVSTYHHVPGPLFGREQIRERLSIAAANRGERVLFVSQASLDGFAARYGGPRRNWTVVHNGIDLFRFSAPSGPLAAQLPTDIAIPAGVPIVTVLGRLGDGKGHATAIAGWPTVLSAAPDAHLLFVGDGPLEADLRAQAAGLGMKSRVIFAGRRPDADRILAASTVSCLPTRREALPTALIEAAACGIPAVASGGSGVVEVVADGVTGLLFPYGDEQALAKAVLELLTDPPRRAAMGKAARRLAEERFDAHVWAEQLHGIYAAARVEAGKRPSNRARNRSWNRLRGSR